MAALRRILRVANDRRIARLDHLLLTVADVQATCDFDARVPGMQVVSLAKAGLRWPALAFGQQKINLHAAGRAFDPKARVPTPRSADLGLIIATAQQQQAQDHIVAAGVTIEQGPIQRSDATCAVLSIPAATRMPT